MTSRKRQLQHPETARREPAATTAWDDEDDTKKEAASFRHSWLSLLFGKVGGRRSASSSWLLPFYWSSNHDETMKQQQEQACYSPRTRRVFHRQRLIQGTVTVIVLVALHQCIVYLSAATTADPRSTTTTPMPALDFVVAGFPKCGTTTLLFALRRHADAIVMSNREVCAMKDKRRAEPVVEQRYRREIAQAWNYQNSEANDSNTAAKEENASKSLSLLQKGIKCPTIVYSDKAIDRLLSWYKQSPSSSEQQPLKWIIGMRHPLHQVQSYYNYLVTEVYDKGYWFYKGIHTLESILLVNNNDEAPLDVLANDASSRHHDWLDYSSIIHSIVGSGSNKAVPWKDMAHDTHRYEIHLHRLLSRLLVVYQGRDETNDNANLQRQQPWVLLYTLEQMEEIHNIEPFQHDFGTFVGLSAPLVWGHENRNRFTGTAAHAETIDLCEARFANLRARLLSQSQQTAQWIEDNLLVATSPYAGLVQVGGGVAAFRTHVQSWKLDVC